MDTLLFASQLMEEGGSGSGGSHHQFHHRQHQDEDEPQQHYYPHEPQQQQQQQQIIHHHHQPQQHHDFETLQMALDMQQQQKQKQHDEGDMEPSQPPPPPPPTSSSSGSPPTLLVESSSSSEEEEETAANTNPTFIVDTSENTVAVATTSNNDDSLPIPPPNNNNTTSSSCISPNNNNNNNNSVMDTLLFASQTLESGTFETAQLEVLQDLKHVKPYAEEIAAHTKHKRGMAALLSWYARLNDFIDFKSQHGHGNVPQKYDPNPRLGYWVNNQRGDMKAYSEGKPNTMNQWKLERLKNVGFVWAKPRGQSCWQNRFDELIEFKKIHGHCNIPTKYKINPALGRWVTAQRRYYDSWKKGVKCTNVTNSEMSERIDKLNEIGFCWRKINNANHQKAANLKRQLKMQQKEQQQQQEKEEAAKQQRQKEEEDHHETNNVLSHQQTTSKTDINKTATSKALTKFI